MKNDISKHQSPHCMNSFAEDEDGTITIFALFMIFIMMMVCGIGVDMMRHEMERTRLQAVADRAVLAAADLDQTQDAKTVVLDYFDKAGLSNYVTADDIYPDVGDGYKIVAVETQLSFPTQFMDFLGVDELHVAATSTAEERVPKVEIALVLDTSSSMKRTGRLDALKPAAVSFVNTVLADDVKDTNSVTLIPFGGQVNPGRAMFDRLNGARLPATPLNEDLGGIDQESDAQNVMLDEDTDGGEGSDPNVKYVYPNRSSCLETEVSGFDSIGMPDAVEYDQTPFFHYWKYDKPNVQHWGWCPRDEFAIQYHTNNRDQLNLVINSMRTYDGTGTHYAMKWATALLDDGAQDDIAFLADLGHVPDEFSQRPAPYSDKETSKFIVLMTDGEISHQYRPVDDLDPRNPTERMGTSARKNSDVERVMTKSTAFNHFQTLCTLAKGKLPRPIVVYTIAFEGNQNARNQMKQCASSESHYFTADRNNIDQTFAAIARKINQLRLTK